MNQREVDFGGNFKIIWSSYDSLSGTNICDETVHVMGHLWVSRQSAESTQVQETHKEADQLGQ